ncbi:MAG: SEC-C domain-containing protein [Clostridiales bacterium]|nr:SEC-C domain-containing protein [Clostridiales bacterium]
MGLFKSWNEYVEKERRQSEYDAFWKAYLEAEKENYENILENRRNLIEGTMKELATEFGMEPMVFAGFIDGINTSLVNAIELDSLEEETAVKLEIDFEKLYFNMLDAKADWLYTIEAWDGILSEERRKEITKEFRVSKTAVSNKVGRNDPCPCGSGKKYKKCCGA